MGQDIQPFDWYRIFLGDLPILFLGEIVFRTVFIYLYALFLIRFVGKRGIGAALTPFEFMIVILLGSAAGDPMFYPDVPLNHAMVVLTVVVLLQKIVAYLTGKFIHIYHYIESDPTLVIQKGKIIKKALEKENISRKEILMQLRIKHIRFIEEVEYAYFEPSS